MPYENSLVVLSMNGPQLKAVLERGYRNYYYYKYVPGYGGYSYYTTCMLDTNSWGRIYYKDTAPALPDGNNVKALLINGKPVDFNDAAKYYNVSTVNYLAAGSCNFNDNGISLWPLNQIVHDTQYYVRDATIDYTTYMGTVSPAIEGRLLFNDTAAPVVTVNAPAAGSYLHSDFLTLDFNAVDGADGTTPSIAPPSGVKTIDALLDGAPVVNGQKIDLFTLALGGHELRVTATDFYGNASTQIISFDVKATVESLQASVTRLYQEGRIKNKGIYLELQEKLKLAAKSTRPENTSYWLKAFIMDVHLFSGKHLSRSDANMLITDAQYAIAHLPDAKPPVITIYSPKSITYQRHGFLWVSFDVDDTITGVKEVTALLDNVPVKNGQWLELKKLTVGTHTLTVTAVDIAGNTATKSVTFKVK